MFPARTAESPAGQSQHRDIAGRGAGSPTHQRVPGDYRAERVLLRTIRCLDGSVDMLLECEPAFNYGRQRGTWQHTFTWLRDSTVMLWGLYTLGLDREATTSSTSPVEPDRGLASGSAGTASLAW